MIFAFSVDVEEWYAGFFDTPEDVARLPSRIEIGVNRILELLASANRKASFFFLGCVAERHPDVVQSVADEGHELGLHGEYHIPLWELDAPRFQEQLRRSRRSVEDRVGRAVVGFRAPLFSIDPSTLWALDVLEDEGFRYDSSVFPIRNPRYGFPSAPRLPFRLRNDRRLVEVPVSTYSFGPLALPFSGGFYLRALPWALVRAGFQNLRACGLPGVLYVHPWELDHEQPQLPIHTLSRARHRIGLRSMSARLEALLREFEFGTIGAMLDLLESAGRLPLANGNFLNQTGTR